MNLAAAATDDKAGQPFSRERVIELARAAAKAPFRPLPQAPERLRQLDYAEYRRINFRPEAALWGNSPGRFSVQLFAPGFLYRDLVTIDVVEKGRAYPLRVAEDAFRVPDPALGRLLAEVGRFTGLRLHYPLNREDYADEFLVFQGASYFRGVSHGQLYGLSARGLAIDTAAPAGEEYPVFRHFWIERPAASDDAIVMHALLDSDRVAGAYRFGIYPGDPLRMDVDVTLIPRERLSHVGLAPFSSMFMFGPADPPETPDYRPAVHDSGGLAMERGNGERLWRPLVNPSALQVSAFMDERPRGFGLIQRSRDFAHFQDLEARYHRRPSAWVEPQGDWGPGHVELVEIPSDSEANDNIVAYWRPRDGLSAGQSYRYRYRLSWPDDAPGLNAMARVVRTAGGHKLFSDRRELMIDWAGTGGVEGVAVEASTSHGRILETTLQSHPMIEGARVFLTFDPGDEQMAEMRVSLVRNGDRIGETWLYRWLADG